MTWRYLKVTGWDPIVARDGRPFGEGTSNRMRGLPWPLPSAVAGSARRAIVVGRPQGDFDEDTIQQLLQIDVVGLFPVVEGKTLYLPAPKNCIWEFDNLKNVDRLHRALPQQLNDGEGCDLPNGLRPVMLDGHDGDDFKPKTTPTWWPVAALAKWLTGVEIRSGRELFQNGLFLNGAVRSERDRIAIDPERGSAAEGQLFSVTDLTVSHLPIFQNSSGYADGASGATLNGKLQPVTLTCRMRSHDWTDRVAVLHPLGGNRRLAHWETQPEYASLWSCPETVRTRLTNSRRVCLMLATPGLFQHGSMPGWLNNMQGCPPGASGLTLKLVGILNDRWKALSRFSWDWRNPGPLPLRRMVPAGAMYFFEVTSGDPAVLSECWLESVADEEQDRRDGFGLAVWGIW